MAYKLFAHLNSTGVVLPTVCEYVAGLLNQGALPAHPPCHQIHHPTSNTTKEIAVDIQLIPQDNLIPSRIYIYVYIYVVYRFHPRHQSSTHATHHVQQINIFHFHHCILLYEIPLQPFLTSTTSSYQNSNRNTNRMQCGVNSEKDSSLCVKPKQRNLCLYSLAPKTHVHPHSPNQAYVVILSEISPFLSNNFTVLMCFTVSVENNKMFLRLLSLLSIFFCAYYRRINVMA